MHMGSSMVVITWLLLAMLFLESIIAEENSEIMGRPTRPKVFTNVDELKKYLELVKDYYAVQGKARYGKRAENSESIIDSPDYAQESYRLKMKLLEQAIQGIEDYKQNQKQHQRLLREQYPDGGNTKLSKPVQLRDVKRSRIYSILTKFDDRPQ